MRIKPLLPVFFIFLLTKNISAQTKIPAFGQVSKDELILKECSFEKDASAMYLLNQETISYQADAYSSKAIYTRRVRIKIFNDKGFEFANIFIKDAKARYTKLDYLDAFVYNLSADGRIVSEPVTKDQIFKEKDSDKKKSVNLRFTFPDLKPGSIIEYRFSKIIKNSFSFEPWLLQNQIPTLVSDLIITTPYSLIVHTHIVAPQLNDTNSIIETPRTTNEGDSKEFVLEKIPSFKIEPYMSSIVDNLERIEFSVSPQNFFIDILDAEKKWQFISSFLMESPFLKIDFDKSFEGVKTKIDSIKKLNSDETKVAAVYDFVTKKVKWNQEQMPIPQNIQDAWKTKSGSSAEINLLLYNMLKNVGVECYPVLISTKENGKIDMEFPNLGQFNGLDVWVNLKDKNYILDGTEEYQSYLVPPFNTINRTAFVIDTVAKWINISDDAAHMNSSTYINAELDSTGMLRGDATITMQDYAKEEELEEDKKDVSEKKEEQKDFLRYDEEGLIIDSISKNDSANKTEPLVIKIKFHYMLSNNDDFYFLNPFFFSMFRKNPFSGTTRYSDIDLGCMQHFLTYINISLPDNFSVEEPLKGTQLRTADTSLSFTKQAAFSEYQIAIKYVIDINNPFFSKDNYPGVKDFFDKMYGFFGQQILLKKKPAQ